MAFLVENALVRVYSIIPDLVGHDWKSRAKKDLMIDIEIWK